MRDARVTRGAWTATLALLLVLTACSPGPDADELASFCAAAEELADATALRGLDLTDVEDLSQRPSSLAVAIDEVDRLAAVPVPPEVAEPWRAVLSPLAAFLQALRDADLSSVTHRDALRAATDALVEPGVVEAGEAVDAYVGDHC